MINWLRSETGVESNSTWIENIFYMKYQCWFIIHLNAVTGLSYFRIFGCNISILVHRFPQTDSNRHSTSRKSQNCSLFLVLAKWNKWCDWTGNQNPPPNTRHWPQSKKYGWNNGEKIADGCSERVEKEREPAKRDDNGTPTLSWRMNINEVRASKTIVKTRP